MADTPDTEYALQHLIDDHGIHPVICQQRRAGGREGQTGGRLPNGLLDLLLACLLVPCVCVTSVCLPACLPFCQPVDQPLSRDSLMCSYGRCLDDACACEMN